MLHVHIGPSPLALGLILPATLAAGLKTCVIGQSGDDSPREYLVSGSGPKGRLRYHQVDWFEGPEVVDDLPEELRAHLAGETPLLLTCSLRGEIVARRQLVEETLDLRPAASETIMLACENAPHAAYADIGAKRASPDFRLLRTVVNRMCIKLDRDSEGRRAVSAHPLGEWLIEDPSEASMLLRALSAVPEVEIVTDIEAREDRKLWMVNGAHQALALVARLGVAKALGVGAAAHAPSDDLRQAARNEKVIDLLDRLHDAMDTALLDRHPQLNGSRDYGKAHVIAYSEHKDSVNRVLESMRRSDLAPFIRTLEVRLAQPARVCRQLGVETDAFAFVFDIFELLIEDIDAFADADEIRDGAAGVTLKTDAEAIEAYEALVAGWNSPEQAGSRVTRFTNALAITRAAGATK